jgi:hypothetical protein
MTNHSRGRSIGITHEHGCLALVTLAEGRRVGEALFPPTTMSAEAIRIYLGDQEGSVDLAIDSALMGHAFDWGRSTLGTTTLVAAAGAGSAETLARYARDAL